MILVTSSRTISGSRSIASPVSGRCGRGKTTEWPWLTRTVRITRSARGHSARVTAAAPDPPLLVVVTGAPASGKTTIAEELARRLRIPLVSKDTFKERLYETLGSEDELEARIERAALALLYSVAAAQLEAGVSVVVESDFDANADPEPLRRMAAGHDARLVQVACRRERGRLVERFVGRIEEGKRHPGHGDEPEDVHEVEAKLDAGSWNPLDLPGELIEVDKDAESFSHDHLAARIRELVASRE